MTGPAHSIGESAAGLCLYDTARGRIEPLRQREAGRVSMYVCGPSVYDVPHLGHGRFLLVYDVLRRFVEFTGATVDHVSNITDIEDKLIERARVEGRALPELAAHYETLWWQAVDALGVKRPTNVPHATRYVGRMIELVQELVAAGAAYPVEDGVYFRADAISDYGLLARSHRLSLSHRSRLEHSSGKRSPLDFALWKTGKPGEPMWASPWGPGRPGWHTECATMSSDLLGEDFDVHGGGVDLSFPHHENERAQTVALGRRSARHWVHSGWVVDPTGEKMSKSAGNFVSLTDMLSTAGGRVFRLYALRAHYRSPITFSRAGVADAAVSLSRLDSLAGRFALSPSLAEVTFADAAPVGADLSAVSRFVRRMNVDLDTPSALAEVFDLARSANSAAGAGDKETARRLAVTTAVLCGALGLRLESEAAGPDDETAMLLARREEARRQRNWSLADSIRAQLTSRGWVVEDGREGTHVRRSR